MLNIFIRVLARDYWSVIPWISEVEISHVQMWMVWPLLNRGVRFNKFGLVDVNLERRYNKFEFDPDNCQYGNLLDDMIDEVNEDNFMKVMISVVMITLKDESEWCNIFS